MSVSVYIRGLIVVKKMRARTLGSVSRWLKKRGPGEGSDPSLRKEPPKGEEGGALFEE